MVGWALEFKLVFAKQVHLQRHYSHKFETLETLMGSLLNPRTLQNQAPNQ